MDLLDFARGPALAVALVIFVLGTLGCLMGVLRRPRMPDLSPPRAGASSNLTFRPTDPVHKIISNAGDMITWTLTFLPVATGMAVLSEPSATPSGARPCDLPRPAAFDQQGDQSDVGRVDAAIHSFVSEFGVTSALHMKFCVHRGLCARACHFHVAAGDPKYTPIRKLELFRRTCHQLRSMPHYA